MSINDPTGTGALPDPPLDDHETLRRLRQAEATIESLLDAFRHQETLVNDLTAASEAWVQAREDLARVERELAAARRAAGWRGIARARKTADASPVAGVSASRSEPPG